jgi:hypothetical protein
MNRAIWIVVIAVGCSRDAAPSAIDAPPGDDSFVGECALALFGSSPDGQCLARWNCKTDGLHTLSCGGLDGGIACLCLIQNMPPKELMVMPANCTDVTAVAAFAREQCGWADL